MAGIAFALFYAFVTNAISTPDADSPPLPSPFSGGYILASQVYGPMAIWPDVEFYSPRLSLFGYLSVGNVLLFVSMGLLATIATLLLVRNIKIVATDRRANASFAGSLLLAFFTNSCCCCTPLILPLLGVVFGSTVPYSFNYLVGPGTPVSNLLVLASLAALFASVSLSARTISRCNLGSALERPPL